MGGHSSGLFSGTSGSLQDGGGNGTISSNRESSGSSQRDAIISKASTPEVERIVNELYRKGATIGDGGTADAIRAEIINGKPTGGRSHIRKGKERLKQIERILRRNPSHPDRSLLERLRDDLKNALEGR